MRKNSRPTSIARGFSLVELMVALLIGLVISIGVVQIFSATRATYQLDESLARAQENGRFALEFLTQDIRHAGYAGCMRDTSVAIFNMLQTPVTPGLFLNGISGAEYNTPPTGFGSTYSLLPGPANTGSGWSPALTGINGVTTALPGSDVIVLQRMVPNSWALIDPYITPLNVFLHPDFIGQVDVNDVMLVSDCRNAAVFMVTAKTPAGVISHDVSPASNRCGRWEANLAGSANAGSASCTDSFAYNPVPTTAIGKLQTIVFFVANDLTDPANPRPTLFRSVVWPTGLPAEAVALVEGVESFQVLYGVDDVPTFDGAADRYVTANNVGDFAKVVSVQIGLLVYGVNATGTANDNTFDTDTHNVAGTNIIPEPNSRRKRRVFDTTIQLRNRSF